MHASVHCPCWGENGHKVDFGKNSKWVCGVCNCCGTKKAVYRSPKGQRENWELSHAIRKVLTLVNLHKYIGQHLQPIAFNKFDTVVLLLPCRTATARRPPVKQFLKWFKKVYILWIFPIIPTELRKIQTTSLLVFERQKPVGRQLDDDSKNKLNETKYCNENIVVFNQ